MKLNELERQELQTVGANYKAAILTYPRIQREPFLFLKRWIVFTRRTLGIISPQGHKLLSCLYLCDQRDRQDQ